MRTRADDTGATTSAKGILLAAALLEMAAMGHHPSVQTSDALEAAREMVASSAAAATVHGLLIALMLVITYGGAVFASRRGMARPLIAIGYIFYSAGVLVMIGAALVSGFVLSDLANARHMRRPAIVPGSTRFSFCAAYSIGRAPTSVSSPCRSASVVGLWIF